MPLAKELRLHGRGGQGTVKASEIIVHSAVRQGLYANSIPYFGFERRGAPVSAFVRISGEPIRPKTQVYHPNCVVVLDETLMNAVDVFEGMPGGSVLVLNTKREPSLLPVKAGVTSVAAVDATGISLDVLGRAVPNTVMLGAFCRATGWVVVSDVAERAAQAFGPSNAKAVMRGYDAVRTFSPRSGGSAAARPSEDGDTASIDEWPETGPHEAPVGTELYVLETGEWRSHRPVWQAEACNGCGVCVVSCPVGAVSFNAGVPPRSRRGAAVDLTYCKGCGICVTECPRDAFSLVEEGVRA